MNPWRCASIWPATAWSISLRASAMPPQFASYACGPNYAEDRSPDTAVAGVFKIIDFRIQSTRAARQKAFGVIHSSRADLCRRKRKPVELGVVSFQTRSPSETRCRKLSATTKQSDDRLPLDPACRPSRSTFASCRPQRKLPNT